MEAGGGALCTSSLLEVPHSARQHNLAYTTKLLKYLKHHFFQTVRARDMKFLDNVSHVTCHVSCVMCQMSCVTCQLSHVTCHVSHAIITCNLLELGTWNFETMLTTPCESGVTCHALWVSHVSHDIITCKLLELGT